MKQARARYQTEHGQLETCKRCEGKGGRRALSGPAATEPWMIEWWKKNVPVRCCASGAVVHYPGSAPGFRTWARETFSSEQVFGKLAQIVAAP